MDRKQFLAVFLAGTLAGVGGEKAIDVIGEATAEENRPVVHAADLRRVSGDRFVSVTAYATMDKQDLGRAVSCDVQAETTQAALEACLNILPKNCTWTVLERR